MPRSVTGGKYTDTVAYFEVPGLFDDGKIEFEGNDQACAQVSETSPVPYCIFGLYLPTLKPLMSKSKTGAPS